jgi:myosin heavy subunit
MTKEQLIKMGLSEGQATAVMKELDGNFVTKVRFDEVNTELKQAKDTVSERDKQLEMLKKSTGDVEALKTQITELQTANKTQAETHAADLKKLKRETLDEQLLREAKAIAPLAVKPFLTPIDDSVDDEGYKAVRQQQIDALTKTENKKFLFSAETPPNTATFVGIKPGETVVPPAQTGGVNPFTKETYDEAGQIKLYRDNPELAKALMKQSGIPIL